MSRRTATRPELRVGGFRLSSITPNGWGGLRHATRVNGAWEVTWTIPNTRTWRHPALVYGAPVELMYGPLCLAPATLEEPDWDSGVFTARGASRDAEDTVALTAGGTNTTAPNPSIDAAIARGVLPWKRVGNFGTTPVGDLEGEGGLVTQQSVLDAWAEEHDSNWAIDNTRSRDLIIRPADESAVDWLIVPGSGVLGSAADERVDRLIVRYIDSTTRKRDTIFYAPLGGRSEKPVDITDRGAMTAAKATSIAQGIWSDLRGQSGWTNGLTLRRGQITTLGGVEADPALVKGGDTMRLLGVPDPRGIAHNLDVVIGDTEYDWEEDELQANPVGRAARDDASVLEQVGNLAVDALAKAGSGAVMPTLDVQSGSVNVSGASVAPGGTATATVSFPRAFASPPAYVDAQGDGFASGGAFLQVRACDQITETDFRIVVVNVGSTAATWTNFPFQWVAIGGIA